jgi:hypothetical protein
MNKDSNKTTKQEMKLSAMQNSLRWQRKALKELQFHWRDNVNDISVEVTVAQITDDNQDRVHSTIQQLIGMPVLSKNGELLGRFEHVYIEGNLVKSKVLIDQNTYMKHLTEYIANIMAKISIEIGE